MRIQTILNRVEKFKSFVYGKAHMEEQAGGPAPVVQVLPRKDSLPYCSGCLRRGRPYDHLKERRFEFVPLWGILVFLAYRTRRVDVVVHSGPLQLLADARNTGPQWMSLTPRTSSGSRIS